MRTPFRVCLSALVILVVGCGGGGGAGDGAEGDSTGFPKLVTSASFQLPALAAPPDRNVAVGIERGRVLTAAGTTAPVGTTVEVVDASTGGVPRVVASGTTDATGSFSIVADLSGVDPAVRWVTADLGGTRLRAFASGWTEVTPGTEVAVVELSRLRRAGRYPVLGSNALATSQELLSLMWLGSHGTLGPSQAVSSLLAEARTHAAWNRWLTQISAGSTTAPGDVAGLVPLSEVKWSSTVVKGGAAPSSTIVSNFCGSGLADALNTCGLNAAADPDLNESLVVDRTSVRLHEIVTSDVLSRLLGQVGDLPLLEFPHAVGTRVLYDNPQFTLQDDSSIRASVRITRRTYPTAAVAALGASPQAVPVVLDYEIAILNTRTSEQVDLLGRERRWFSPKAGRVQVEAQVLLRTGAQVATDSLTLTADHVSGVEFMPPVTPFAGLADAQAVGLRHYHAVHSQVLDRVYVASPNNGGTIVELTAQSLSPLRTLNVGTVPRRLALAADGQRIFAGLDDGTIAEWRLSDLALLSRTSAVTNPDGGIFDRVHDLSIDPFDPRRVLALMGSSATLGGGIPVLLFRDGSLLLRDVVGHSWSPWGWGYYAPYAVSWTSTRDEFLVPGMSGQDRLFRFSIGPDSFVELSSVGMLANTGWTEVGGELVMERGAVLDAMSFAPKRTLALAPLFLDKCARFDLTSSLCQFRNEGSAPPNLLLLDHASGEFLGVYRPEIASASNGCLEVSVREGSLGLDSLSLTPMGAGRVLASSLSAGNDGSQRCSLQVWKLRGVPQ